MEKFNSLLFLISPIPPPPPQQNLPAFPTPYLLLISLPSPATTSPYPLQYLTDVTFLYIHGVHRTAIFGLFSIKMATGDNQLPQRLKDLISTGAEPGGICLQILAAFIINGGSPSEWVQHAEDPSTGGVSRVEKFVNSLHCCVGMAYLYTRNQQGCIWSFHSLQQQASPLITFVGAINPKKPVLGLLEPLGGLFAPLRRAF